MPISTKEWLAKPHPGQEPLKFFMYFLDLFRGVLGGSDRPPCYPSAVMNGAQPLDWSDRMVLLGDTPGRILIHPRLETRPAGKHFCERRDYISNGARLCLGGLPKELRAAMRGATHFPANADRNRLTAARCRDGRPPTRKAGDGGRKFRGARVEERMRWGEVGAEAAAAARQPTRFFPLGGNIFNSKWVQSPGCKPPGNIYSCYRATLKGDCVVWSCFEEFFSLFFVFFTLSRVPVN